MQLTICWLLQLRQLKICVASYPVVLASRKNISEAEMFKAKNMQKGCSHKKLNKQKQYVVGSSFGSAVKTVKYVLQARHLF